MLRLLPKFSCPRTLCGGGDLLFLLSPPAAATCFCSDSKTPYSDYFQIFTVCILALGNLPGKFFFAFFSFFNNIQDGRQNPMAHARAQTASSICFMFGLKARPYSGAELKTFWFDFDFYVFVFQRIFLFCSFWPSSKFGNIAIHPYSDYF